MKGQIVHILGFVGPHTLLQLLNSVIVPAQKKLTATQKDGCGCAPTKPYLQKQVMGQILWKANADWSVGQAKA